MKYALITGASSGIGLGLAKCFAREGCGLVLAASGEQGLEEAGRQLRKDYSVPVLTFAQDLSRPGGAQELYRKAVDGCPEISILINNAGFGLVGPTEEIPMEQEKKMLTLNVESPVVLSKLFLEDCYRRSSGVLLNVASTGAFQPGPYTSTYFAGKAFLLSYSRAIRYEAQAKGVQVSVLCPGATRTRFFQREGTGTPRYAMDPDAVARYAYRKLKQNREIIIPGLLHRLERLAPIRLKMRVVAGMKQGGQS